MAFDFLSPLKNAATNTVNQALSNTPLAGAGASLLRGDVKGVLGGLANTGIDIALKATGIGAVPVVGDLARSAAQQITGPVLDKAGELASKGINSVTGALGLGSLFGDDNSGKVVPGGTKNAVFGKISIELQAAKAAVAVALPPPAPPPPPPPPPPLPKPVALSPAPVQPLASWYAPTNATAKVLAAAVLPLGVEARRAQVLMLREDRRTVGGVYGG